MKTKLISGATMFLLLFLGGNKSYLTQEKADVSPYPVGGIDAIGKNVVYPESAKKAGVEGMVVVEAVIDIDGNVISTKISKSDNAQLNDAAADAVSKTKFKPGRDKGKTVKSTVVVPIRFKLDDHKKEK